MNEIISDGNKKYQFISKLIALYYKTLLNEKKIPNIYSWENLFSYPVLYQN